MKVTLFLNFLFIVIIFIMIALGVLSYMVGAPVNHDENMYISAGVLIQDQCLYQDFAYLQMPYLPFV